MCNLIARIPDDAEEWCTGSADAIALDDALTRLIERCRRNARRYYCRDCDRWQGDNRPIDPHISQLRHMCLSDTCIADVEPYVEPRKRTTLTRSLSPKDDTDNTSCSANVSSLSGDESDRDRDHQLSAESEIDSVATRGMPSSRLSFPRLAISPSHGMKHPSRALLSPYGVQPSTDRDNANDDQRLGHFAETAAAKDEVKRVPRRNMARALVLLRAAVIQRDKTDELHRSDLRTVGEYVAAATSSPSAGCALAPEAWDVNNEKYAHQHGEQPQSDPVATMRVRMVELHASLDLHGAFDRVKLVGRRRIGSLLRCLQVQYKLTHQRGTQRPSFYEHIKTASNLPPKATKEYLKWYHLCVALPSVVCISVSRWSDVQTLMKGQVLHDAIRVVVGEAGVRLAAGKMNQDVDLMQFDCPGRSLTQLVDPVPVMAAATTSSVSTQLLYAAPSKSGLAVSIRESGGATPSGWLPHGLRGGSARSSAAINDDATAVTQHLPTATATVFAAPVSALPLVPVAPRSSPTHSAAASASTTATAAATGVTSRVASTRPPAAWITTARATAATSTPHIPHVLATPHVPLAPLARFGIRPSDETAVRFLRVSAALQLDRKLPAGVNINAHSFATYRQRIIDFVQMWSITRHLPQFDPRAAMLPGVSPGWLGISMLPDGNCAYHLIGLMYDRTPAQLKQCV